MCIYVFQLGVRGERVFDFTFFPPLVQEASFFSKFDTRRLTNRLSIFPKSNLIYNRLRYIIKIHVHSKKTRNYSNLKSFSRILKRNLENLKRFYAYIL